MWLKPSHSYDLPSVSTRHAQLLRLQPARTVDANKENVDNNDRIAVVDVESNADRFKLASYLRDQVFWKECEPPDEEELRNYKRIAGYNFIQIPWGLEKVITLGFFICLDQFLYLFTLLPLRLMAFCFEMLIRRNMSSVWKFLHETTNINDFLRFVLVSVALGMLLLMDLSQIYHYIRAQSTIKLYVVFNVLEVMDRLCTSVGQQLLDSACASIYEWGCKRNSKKLRMLFLDCSICIGHLCAHSVVLLLQVVTLNVAINSQNNALLTLLISNNFVELKSNVFKKFEVENLMQITCADIVERFSLFVFLGLVTLQNVPSASQHEPWLKQWMSLVIAVYFSEVVIDWIKHFFVCKFNKIEAVVYPRYARVLYDDIAQLGLHLYSRQMGVDPTQRIARRIGFVPLPLVCVVLRVCLQALCNPTGLECLSRLSSLSVLLFLGCIWLLLMALKMFVHIVLLSLACHRLRAEKAAPNAPSDRLLNIDRFSLLYRVQF